MIRIGNKKLVGDKGEDSAYCNYSHVDHGASEIASFGIFDGHFGSLASRTCAAHLHPAIIARFVDMKEKSDSLVAQLTTRLQYPVEAIDFLNSEGWMDALLGEAIRMTYKIIDGEIRRIDKSGTTAVSVFVRKRFDESARITVANVGDSRCALFSPKNSEMHRLAMSSGQGAGVEYAKAKCVSPEGSLVDLIHFFKSFNPSAFPVPLVPIVSTRDHSLTNPEERRRICDAANFRIKWDPHPIEVLLAAFNESHRPRLHSSSEEILQSLVLVVDSNPLCRKMIAHIVRLIGFVVEEAENGFQGCKIFQAATAVRNPFHLVIVDDCVDDMSFLWECIPKSLPIIMISDDHAAFDSFCEVLVRPLTIDKLKDVLKKFQPLFVNQLSKVVSTKPVVVQSSIDRSTVTTFEGSLASLSPPESFTRATNLSENISSTNLIPDTNIMQPSIDQYISSVSDLLSSEMSNSISSVILSETNSDDSMKIVNNIQYIRSNMTILTLAHICPEAGYSERDVSFDSTLSKFICPTYQLGVSKLVTPDVHDATTADDFAKGYTLQRENSIISTRKLNESSRVGPEVIFSRFNDVSISMTRCIGGRYAPRRCIPLPDLIAVDVKPGGFVRCVLATDGLWDVISVQKVAIVINRYDDPQLAADALAEKAFKRRTEKGIRLDDITVTVVDINVTEGNASERLRSSSGSGKSVISVKSSHRRPSESSVDTTVSSATYVLAGQLITPDVERDDGCTIF